ncbi:MAG: TetR/AcrR family transcriptional regulator [Acidimicrobiales bacterium]
MAGPGRPDGRALATGADGDKTRQAARSWATRAELLGAARSLFGTRGFADTSTEEVVRLAGVTRGALYHHFTSKEDLFRAVFEQVKQEQSESVCAALMSGGPWTGLLAACAAMIDAHLDPAVRRIVLLDSRAVLGGPVISDVDGRYGAVSIRAGLRRATNAGLLERQPLVPLARLIVGAISEACMLIAEAEDPVATRSQVDHLIERLLSGLRPLGTSGR